MSTFPFSSLSLTANESATIKIEKIKKFPSTCPYVQMRGAERGRGAEKGERKQEDEVEKDDLSEKCFVSFDTFEITN